jgi:hypothetical protein
MVASWRQSWCEMSTDRAGSCYQGLLQATREALVHVVRSTRVRVVGVCSGCRVHRPQPFVSRRIRSRRSRGGLVGGAQSRLVAARLEIGVESDLGAVSASMILRCGCPLMVPRATRSRTTRASWVGATFHDGGGSSPTTSSTLNSAATSESGRAALYLPHTQSVLPQLGRTGLPQRGALGHGGSRNCPCSGPRGLDAERNGLTSVTGVVYTWRSGNEDHFHAVGSRKGSWDPAQAKPP